MPTNSNRRRLRVSRMMIFLPFCIAVTAQSQQTNAVRVKLNTGCRVPFNAITKLDGGDSKVERKYPILILNGNEGVPARLKATDSQFEWTGDWHDPERPGRQFDSAGSCGSLRLHGTRTDCRLSTREKHDDVIEAVFDFNCDENRAWEVIIHTEPFNFSYVRFLKRSQRKKVYCDCGEHADDYRTKTILDVRLPTEVVYLGLEYPGDTLWMRLNELPIFNKPKEGASDTLNHDRVAEVIVRSTPGEKFSPNAYKIVKLNPKIKRDTKLSVTVN